MIRTMLWIMGNVVKADQFESVTIFRPIQLWRYGFGVELSARSLAIMCVYLLYNMWVKQCLQMERMITQCWTLTRLLAENDGENQKEKGKGNERESEQVHTFSIVIHKHDVLGCFILSVAVLMPRMILFYGVWRRC